MNQLTLSLSVISLGCLLRNLQAVMFPSKLAPLSNDCSSLAFVVNEISQKVFSKYAEMVNFVSAENATNFGIRDLKDELFSISSIDPEFIIRQSEVNHLNSFEKRTIRCSVIFVQSLHEFTEILDGLPPNALKFSARFLVVLMEDSISEVDQIFQQFWSRQISNVNVISQNKSDGTVLVQSFSPFNKRNCNDTSPKVVNRFVNGKFERNLDSLFVTKLNNLYKCPIRVSIANESEPFVFIKTFPNGSQTLSGGAIEIISALAECLNFKLDYTYIGNEGYFYENGSALGPFKALIDETADISVQNWWIKAHRLKYLECTSPYESEPVVFVVPPGRDLTTFEKLTYPFSVVLWMTIVSCFMIGFVVIALVKLTSNQNFVFGKRVANPYLNMFVAFIGGVQPKLPRRNFARFLLMCFLMYSLVIRTIYQGSFYQLLRSNKHKNEVQTIDEMIERDFKFYTLTKNMDVFQGTEPIYKRLSPVSYKEYDRVVFKIRTDASFKGAAGRSIMRLVYYNMMQTKENRFTICKDVVMSLPVVIYSRKNFFLLGKLNEKMDYLKAAGLIPYWYYKGIDYRYMKAEHSNQPQVLRVGHLLGCFQLLICGIVVSSICLLAELLAIRLRRMS